MRALYEGTFEGPIVPIGCRPPEARRAAQREPSAAEETSFLREKGEQPEEPPRESEGGSSGSGGPAPAEGPAEVPAEAPPLPPPEEPPSKGEGVKQRIAEAPARLEVEAYVQLEDEFIVVAKPGDLREEDRMLYEAVRGAGLGICARCKWLSGCHSCDELKAWGFACRSTLWHTAHEG